MSKSFAMEYADSLQRFDAQKHLNSGHLRALEKKHGYAHLHHEGDEETGDWNKGKVLKANYEVRMLTETLLRMQKSSSEHPPYGLPMPLANPLSVAGTEPQKVQAQYLSPEETQEVLQQAPLKTVHALSDLKIQLILNDLFLELAENVEFLTTKMVGDLYAKHLSGLPVATWKIVVQSAASNAKRNEFMVLKQIVLQALRQKKRLPSREEFMEIAGNSLNLLQLLATTHQTLFSTINGRLIADNEIGKYSHLVSKDGKPQLVLSADVLDGLSCKKSEPNVRTMCPAIHAKDASGTSMLEYSYKEDTAIVADMLYRGQEPLTNRFNVVATEVLPKQSAHMYTKLAVVDS